MAYASISLVQALYDLGRRLYDFNSTFWTDVEKTVYLQEAVRTFAAYTSFYRTQFNLFTTVNQHWYDIPSAPASPRPFTVTDVDLYRIMQYHLLEPASGATWTGTEQFTALDLLKAVQTTRDQLLGDTGCTLARSTQPTNGTLTNPLDQSVIDIRRLAYFPVIGSPSPLWRDDVWAQESFSRNNRTPGTPRIYKQSTQPPLAFKTNIVPSQPGTYELLTTNSGALLFTVDPTIMIIPDDWTWAIKWGALAILLSRESAARDPMRAAYCAQRYTQVVSLLKSSPALLYAELDYEPIDIDAVQSADDYRVRWQGETAGTPKSMYVAGQNYFAVRPKPAAIVPLTLTVLQNSPFPATAYEYFQFGLEDYDAILKCAHHIAAFKQGGAEFSATIPLYQEFIAHCAQYNSKLAAMGEFTDVLYSQSQLQEQADGTTAAPPMPFQLGGG